MLPFKDKAQNALPYNQHIMIMLFQLIDDTHFEISITMKNSFFFVMIIFFFSTFSQAQYEPNWESLDKRKTPEWFKDAKFGIFIHWGVYSVPAYRPFIKNDEGETVMSGIYAEWYAPDVMYKPELNDSFHIKNYGKDFEYFDFAPLFTAELFQPAYWAELFKRAGAKYVILTSKHCEGFTMWPSKEKYSENWNVADVGPKRDLLGDLTKAVKAQGLKMGYYYSFLEYWTTKTDSWPANLEERNGYYVPEKVWEKYHIPNDDFVDRIHFHIKELINNYQPDIIWADAEWDHDAEYWRSKELLAWIYNNAPNAETLAVNDRWAKNSRGKHGGYYTTEYGHGMENVKDNHPWEECRGMAYSFGYNRAEQIVQYKTSAELIHTLIEIVSKGGNLLLNIGPTADGRIPVIMQQRLVDIGNWLNINGEAIYGTRPVTQKIEVAKPVQQVFFTQKNDKIFVILTAWPYNDVVIKNIDLDKNVNVKLFGFSKDINYSYKSKTLRISPPCLNPDKSSAAYVFEISGLHK